MNVPRLFSISGKLILSLGVTWGIAYLDATEARFTQIQSGLHMARQIADQIQSLSLYGREKQEHHSVTWASRFLNAGMKNRPVKIMPVQLSGNSLSTEKYRLNEKATTLSYYKCLYPETGEGIQVDIQLDYIGFLGSHSVEANDLLLAALFCFTFVSISFGIKRLKEKKSSSTELFAYPNDQTLAIEQRIEDWVTEAKTALVQLGLNIKGMTQEVKILVLMASRSKSHLEKVIRQEQLENSGSINQGHSKNDEARMALESYRDISNSTHNINESITKTTESVIYMAKLIQKLKKSNQNTSLE